MCVGVRDAGGRERLEEDLDRRWVGSSSMF